MFNTDHGTTEAGLAWREPLHGLEPDDETTQLRASVQSAMAAIKRMQECLLVERERCRQLELDAVAARQVLSKLHDELAILRASEQGARHLALHDQLTTLPNRAYFCQRLDQELAHAQKVHQSLAVLFIDLDDFKAVNDTHGHAMGDRLLGIVATRLRRAIRADDVVGRWGGDEFACLLRASPGREHLGRLACKLFDAVSDPVRIGELALCVHPSIGIAVYPDCGTDADALVAHADAAMYHAKRHQMGYASYDQV